MLCDTDKFDGCKLRASDGEIGKVKDVLFDDASWRVRYLVVDTGNWLTSRKVLISPQSLGAPDWKNEEIPVNLSKAQVEGSPPLGADEPVSRQHEMDVAAYFGWPVYWRPPGIPVGVPGAVVDAHPAGATSSLSEAHGKRPGDPHLRSADAVSGYHIQATDGEIGHIEGLIVDDRDWQIHDVIVDTRNWLPGRRTLVSPDRFKRFDWEEAKAEVAMSREAIKACPAYQG